MAQQFKQYSNEAQELGFNIIAHTGTPVGNVSAIKGSVYIKTDASGTTDRIYICTLSGSNTAWAYVTTSA